MLTSKQSFKITHFGQLQIDAVVILIDHLIDHVKMLNLKNMLFERVLKSSRTPSGYATASIFSCSGVIQKIRDTFFALF